ncbi:MAG: superoxide dismutase family protein [Myxococcota bacterium]
MLTRKTHWTALAAASILAASTGCDLDRGVARYEPEPPAEEPKAEKAVASAYGTMEKFIPKPQARAQLRAAAGADIVGDVEFYDTDEGVRVVANVTDADPGQHGFHVHEKGDCSDMRAGSMGGHFAPEGKPHALPDETKQRHLGDLGNLRIKKGGTGHLEITIEGANLKEHDAKSFLGRAIVVHKKKDAGKSEQPSGASGDPIACGVINEV